MPLPISQFPKDLKPTQGMLFGPLEANPENAKLVRLEGQFLYLDAPSFAERQAINLIELRLPPNILYPDGRLFMDHPELLGPAVRAVRLRAPILGESKSLPRTLRALFVSIIALLRYGWVHGIYRAKDWTKTHFQEALTEFCKGGLPGLRMSGVQQDNTLTIQLNTALEVLSQELVPGILQDNSTDSGPEVSCDAHLRRERSKMSASAISTFVNVCNLLADAAELDFQPFVNPRKLANKLGRPSGSSETVGALELANFMREAYVFYLAVRRDLLDVFDGARRFAEDRQCATEKEMAPKIAALPAFIELKKKVMNGTADELRTSRDIMNFLYTLTEAFHVSSFYLVGFMNARRPDELVHKAVGVKSENIRSIDLELGLHQVDFYLEKGPRIRVPFFINELSHQIFRDLEKIANSAPSWMKENVAYSVFAVPDYRENIKGLRNIKKHRHESGYSARFKAVMAVCRPLSRPHEFRSMRRGYAMLYQYRYVYSSIPALQQQLGHETVQEVYTYITSAIVAPEKIAQLFGSMSSEQEAARFADYEDLASELNIVGEERLLELVTLVLNQDPTVIGGFHKLIRRFHRTLAQHVSYSEMDANRQASTLHQTLKQRGHSLFAKRDGDCWRGNSRSKHRGGCQMPGDVGPRLDNVSLETCNGCAYHTAFQEHTSNLKEDASSLEQSLLEAPLGSLVAKRNANSLALTRKVIRLREAAMGVKQDG